MVAAMIECVTIEQFMYFISLLPMDMIQVTEYVVTLTPEVGEPVVWTPDFEAQTYCRR